MSEQSHVSVRQTIDGLLAKQRQTSLSNLGTLLQQLKVCCLSFHSTFDLAVGLNGLKKTQNLKIGFESLSNGSNFQLVFNCTCSHSLSSVERIYLIQTTTLYDCCPFNWLELSSGLYLLTAHRRQFCQGCDVAEAEVSLMVPQTFWLQILIP